MAQQLPKKCRLVSSSSLRSGYWGSSILLNKVRCRFSVLCPVRRPTNILKSFCDSRTAYVASHIRKKILYVYLWGHNKMRSGVDLQIRSTLVSFNHVTDLHFVTFSSSLYTAIQTLTITLKLTQTLILTVTVTVLLGPPALLTASLTIFVQSPWSRLCCIRLFKFVIITLHYITTHSMPTVRRGRRHASGI